MLFPIVRKTANHSARVVLYEHCTRQRSAESSIVASRPMQEVSGNKDKENMWQKISVYHKLTTRILEYFLPGISTERPYCGHIYWYR